MTRIAAAKWPLVLMGAVVAAVIVLGAVVAAALLLSRSDHADLRMLR